MRTKLKMSGLLAVALGGAGVACSGGDDDGPPGMFADAAPAPDGRADAAPPDAAPPIDAPRDPDGPAITVLSPTASDEIDSASIVTADRFTARCRAAPNVDTGTPVDSATVRMVLFGGGGATREQPAQPTPTQHEYVADFSVADFPNGPLEVRCTASDTAMPPSTNSAANHTFLDLGPAITVFAPVAGASYRNQLDVVFRVDPAPLRPGDDGAAVNVGSIALAVAGRAVTVTGPDAEGVYAAAIVFDDPDFTPALDGEQTLLFTAHNTRLETPVTRSQRVLFVADSDGPVVVIEGPLAGELVGGIFTVSARITDPAGVNPLSVVATLAHDFEFDLVAGGGDLYTAAFDSRALANSWVFPLLEVRAQDAVGNQSSVGQLLALDNRSPIASLDPPPLREARLNEDAGLLECSDRFDPVGSDAVNDGESVAQLSELRVRIEDRGNGATATSGVIIPIAGVDLATVQLFVQDVTDGPLPLLVDTDDDGVCDQINPAITPTSAPMSATEAAVVDLVPIGDEGASRFSNPVQPPYETTPGHPEVDCNQTEDDNQPNPLCVSTPLTRVIKAEIGGAPVIFGIPPLTDLACLGNAFDSAASNISDGWACLAVRAHDTLGNVGISPPLRVCFDADNDQSDGCGVWGSIADEALRPSCTADCELPYSFASDPAWQLRRNDL